jgi:glycosyltransferase involved in cell wall biosynthesis
MMLLLISFVLLTVLELSGYTKLLWSHRKAYGAAVVIGLSLQAGFVIGAYARGNMPDYPVTPILLFLVAFAYRAVNLTRVASDKTHEKQLHRTGFRTALIIAAVQLAVLVTGFIHPIMPLIQWIYIASIVLLAGSCVLLVTAVRTKDKMTVPKIDHGFASRDLPTVTVAIPARNETEDLEQCLTSLVSSNYPKLEILVLDDCSQDRRTPEIIRQFAHDGVRFIAGNLPPEQWLAKNYAYKQLSDAANGEFILFCGVDARFDSQSISKIVESMIMTDQVMVSVMPVNDRPKRLFESLLIQPLRYAWEIAVPRRWSKRPPLLSTCWVIRKDFLEENGGLQAVTRTILPERYFARNAYNKNKYSFYYADAQIGLRCVKSASEQRDTAIRMRYPQLHRRPEYAMVLTVIEVAMLLGPGVMAVYAILEKNALLLAINAAAIAVFNFVYVFMARMTYRRWSFLSPLIMPVALLYDVFLLNVSMKRYEFSDVYWKGRNVCIPVLQVYPTLPKLR